MNGGVCTRASRAMPSVSPAAALAESLGSGSLSNNAARLACDYTAAVSQAGGTSELPGDGAECDVPLDTSTLGRLKISRSVEPPLVELSATSMKTSLSTRHWKTRGKSRGKAEIYCLFIRQTQFYKKKKNHRTKYSAVIQTVPIETETWSKRYRLETKTRARHQISRKNMCTKCQ